MMQKLNKLFKEKGQGIVEYAMVLGFVALLAVGLWTSKIQNETKRVFISIGDNLSRSVTHISGYNVTGQ